VQAFRSERVSTPEGIQPGAVLVRDEKIEGFVRFAEIPTGAEVHDFGQAAILPGLVDSHVHINDPGRAEWEGFETATRAAAAGGYTTLVDMPLNCLPATTTVAALDAKRTAAHGRSWVDWRAWGGVVSDNQAHVEALALAGVAGFKSFLIHPGIDGFTMVSESELRAALPHVARTGLPLLVHAELSGPVDEATRHLENQNANWNRYSTYLQSRPQEAELRAIRLLISLCREFEFRLHIVHLSAAKALPELCAARAEGLPITVETCPHYLHFCAEEIADGETLSKCAPPIRSRENREKLWQSLKDGIIDLVATDHSPCPPAMKQRASGNFKSAWGGISSLSMALPVMWTEASQRGFSLTDLTRWMASATAQLAGCLSRKGQIVEGGDADFVIFEPEEEFVVSEDRLYHRHPTSPYAGKKLRGIVKATFLRGQLVFSKGEFCGKARGQELS
jgi:allantoinase